MGKPKTGRESRWSTARPRIISFSFAFRIHLSVRRTQRSFSLNTRFNHWEFFPLFHRIDLPELQFILNLICFSIIPPSSSCSRGYSVSFFFLKIFDTEVWTFRRKFFLFRRILRVVFLLRLSFCSSLSQSLFATRLSRRCRYFWHVYVALEWFNAYKPGLSRELNSLHLPSSSAENGCSRKSRSTNTYVCGAHQQKREFALTLPWRLDAAASDAFHGHHLSYIFRTRFFAQHSPLAFLFSAHPRRVSRKQQPQQQHANQRNILAPVQILALNARINHKMRIYTRTLFCYNFYYYCCYCYDYYNVAQCDGEAYELWAPPPDTEIILPLNVSI